MLNVGENFILLGCPSELWIAFQQEEAKKRDMVSIHNHEYRSTLFKNLSASKQSETRLNHRNLLRDNTSLLGFIMRCSSEHLYSDFALDFDNLILDSNIDDRHVSGKIKERIRRMIAANAITEFKSELMLLKGVSAKAKLASLG